MIVDIEVILIAVILVEAINFSYQNSNQLSSILIIEKKDRYHGVDHK